MKSGLLYLLIIACLCACESRDYQLEQRKVRYIKKESKKQIDSLRPILDSLCLERESKVIGKLVDSLLEVRLKEIEEKIQLPND